MMDQSCEAVHSEAADKHSNVTDCITSLTKLLTTTNKPLYKAKQCPHSPRILNQRRYILCVRNIVFLKFYNCCNKLATRYGSPPLVKSTSCSTNFGTVSQNCVWRPPHNRFVYYAPTPRRGH